MESWWCFEWNVPTYSSNGVDAWNPKIESQPIFCLDWGEPSSSSSSSFQKTSFSLWRMPFSSFRTMLCSFVPPLSSLPGDKAAFMTHHKHCYTTNHSHYTTHRPSLSGYCFVWHSVATTGLEVTHSKLNPHDTLERQCSLDFHWNNIWTIHCTGYVLAK